MGGFWARAALYAAALVGGWSFGLLFTGQVSRDSIIFDSPGSASTVMFGAALVAVLVGSAGRWRFVLVPPAAALYAMLVTYGFPPVTISGWRELVPQVRADLYEAANVMYLQPVPYDLTPGLQLVFAPLVIVLVALATSATLYEGSPVVSVAILGLTIGVISTVAFEAGAGPYFFFFLLFAALLFAAAGSEGSEEGFGGGGVLAAVALVALVVMLPRAPLSDVTVASGLVDWTRIGAGGPARLDVQADVGDYLDSGRDTALLRVRSDEPLLWRAGTLDRFDGIRWEDTTEPGEDYGEEVGPNVPTRLVPQTVQVLNAETDRIWGGYNIVDVSSRSAERIADGSWTAGGRTLDEGSMYRVLSRVPQPTEDQLRAAGTSYSEAVEEKYLQLSDDTPPVVAETAALIGEEYDASTPYDIARAIEQYLIYDGGFVYNLDADYRRADQAIERFLGDEREGFCTQFATSMALIARDMGVPSRVVYGSTSGQEDEPGHYVVTGANVHTWVELYFPGVGWYPFDPTPGFQLPQTMEANAPRPEVPFPQGSNQDEAFMRGLEDQNPDSQAADAPPDSEDENEAAAREDRAPRWPLLLLIVPVLPVAVVIAKRALRARGRPEDLYRDLTGRLRDVPPVGDGRIADSPALTPTERVLLLAGAADVEEEPFRRFARAYTEHLYSGRGGPGREVSSAYRRAVRAYERLPLWRRALGEVNPSSLLARAGAWLAGLRTNAAKKLRRQKRR